MNDSAEITKPNSLPNNLPVGAKAFQAAVDDKLTKEIWSQILDAQIAKAKEGDRGAAKFLLEYAGGVASMRGATFVQENHHHEHYHEADDEKSLSKTPRKLTNATLPGGDVPTRSISDYELERERRAKRAAAGSDSMKFPCVIYYAYRDPSCPPDLLAIELTVHDGQPHGRLERITPQVSRDVHDYAELFDWGRKCVGCRQLALAILLDFLGAEAAAQAWRIHEHFADEFLCRWKLRDLKINGRLINAWIDAAEAALRYGGAA